MKHLLLLALLFSMTNASCVTVNDRPPQAEGPPLPKRIIIKSKPDCLKLADEFTIKMTEAELFVNRENSSTAYVQEAQQGGKYFALVIKKPDYESLDWNNILNGYMFKCTYKNVVLDVILKQ